METAENILFTLAMAGYFAACPVVSASVTVDDPLRPYYKKSAPTF